PTTPPTQTPPSSTPTQPTTPPAVHPAIAITKNPKSQTVASGGTATFTIKVTNTGDVDLNNVTVTDAQAPGCARNLGTLLKGTNVQYTCTQTGITAAETNVAIATGTAGGQTVTAQDTAAVKVAAL